VVLVYKTAAARSRFGVEILDNTVLKKLSHPMTIQAGKKVVNDILTQPHWDIGALLLAASERAVNNFGLTPGKYAFEVAACDTQYGFAPSGMVHHELQTWFLAILLAEYTAGILAQKAEEGHCQKHRIPPDLKGCPVMAVEHRRMLLAFRDSLQQIVDDISTLEGGLQLPPPAVSPKT
jgi:hypothetical protein